MNDRVIEMVSHVLRAKIIAIVEQGFEGWEGTIRPMAGYVFEVKIEVKERPHD